MEQLDQHSQGCTTLPSALETNHSTDKGWNQFYERLDLAPTPKKWEMIGQGRSVAESWITYEGGGFVSRKGRLLGLVPEATNEDVFCVFRGSPAPIVGRKDGDAVVLVVLVGDSCVLDLMQGSPICAKQAVEKDIAIR